MKEISTMKGLPESERPYEKCERFGPEKLSDSELLAVILRSGTTGRTALQLAMDIIYGKDSRSGLLNIHKWSMEQLCQIKGVGKVKAIQVLCISELAKRLSKAEAIPALSFHNPQTIADCYMEDMRHQKQEIMKLLLLNTKSKLIGETDISKGTINGTMITPREIFVNALEKGATNIVLLHNHPSGDPTPSKDDVMVTKRIQSAGEYIGIELLDHIIIGNNRFISFREKGIL